jgi:hypothetical protein
MMRIINRIDNILQVYLDDDNQFISCKINYPLTTFVNDQLIPLTEAELDTTVLNEQTITFRDDTFTRTYTNIEGYFTVRSLFEIIEQYENEHRPLTNWFGGIDCHHRFFEGIWKSADGTYEIWWGS